MNTISLQACQALKAWPQWVNYELVPQPGGKVAKYPISAITGVRCSVTDPASWASFEQASSNGRPVGFVFTESDPFFFVDMDHCWDGQAWSADATMICNMFQGCAVEISQSGTGLHVFGTIPDGVPHGCDCKAIGSQFYTRDRFVALTGNAMTGDAGVMPDPNYYKWFVDNYFPPKEVLDLPAATGEAPTMDDAELIAKAMESSQGAMGQLQGKATFQQLWSGDTAALTKAWPREHDPNEFDWSSADSALCGHLAFWTGKNQEQIKRLWGLSALGQRDKFRDRSRYVIGTIEGACQHCKNVYTVEPTEAYGLKYLHAPDLLPYFEGCVYVRSLHKVFMPDGELLPPATFKVVKSGYMFETDDQKMTKDAWEAFSNNRVFKAQEVKGLCFEPKLKLGDIVAQYGNTEINTYDPVDVDCHEGDPTWFLDLLARLLPDPNDRTILLSYMASMVQNPGTKFRWAPVLQGTFGNGKSTITRILRRCITHKYCGNKYYHAVTAKDIKSDFNGWLKEKLFIAADETDSRDAQKLMESLKTMITETSTSIQAKGVDQVTLPNYANFMFCMNDKDSILKHKDDRRFAVFYTPQQCKGDLTRDGLTTLYFNNLNKWLDGGGYGITTWYLRNYQIDDAHNPATLCQTAPKTSSTAEAIIASRSIAAQEIQQAIDEGLAGFRGPWVSATAAALGIKVPANKWPLVMAELGYVKMGKTSRRIPEEGGKQVRLYIKEGTPVTNATEEFCRDQGYFTAPH